MHGHIETHSFSYTLFPLWFTTGCLHSSLCCTVRSCCLHPAYNRLHPLTPNLCPSLFRPPSHLAAPVLFSLSLSLFPLLHRLSSLASYLGFHIEVISYGICLSVTYLVCSSLGPSIHVSTSGNLTLFYLNNICTLCVHHIFMILCQWIFGSFPSLWLL